MTDIETDVTDRVSLPLLQAHPRSFTPEGLGPPSDPPGGPTIARAPRITSDLRNRVFASSQRELWDLDLLAAEQTYFDADALVGRYHFLVIPFAIEKVHPNREVRL